MRTYSALLAATLAACAAVPDVRFVDDSASDGGDASADGPVTDGPTLDGAANTCPAQVPAYASACCGAIACSGANCATACADCAKCSPQDLCCPNSQGKAACKPNGRCN